MTSRNNHNLPLIVFRKLKNYLLSKEAIEVRVFYSNEEYSFRFKLDGAWFGNPLCFDFVMVDKNELSSNAKDTINLYLSAEIEILIKKYFPTLSSLKIQAEAI
jgi:hypothetical protein